MAPQIRLDCYIGYYRELSQVTRVRLWLRPSRMLISLKLRLSLRKHISLHLSIRSRLFSMAHPVVSSGPHQIPALSSQHKEPKSQKEKKSKTVPVSQFPLEVCCHGSISACCLTHHFFNQLQPAPDFFGHRVKIFEDLRAEYDAFVQGLHLSFYTRLKLTTASTTASGNHHHFA
jgi:hypothetical protein